VVNKEREQHGIRCAARPTGGSIYNLNALRADELQFGIAQSEWLHHAYHGTSLFEAQGRFDGLRAVFSVNAEPFSVLARAGSGIDSFEDLAGKRVNAGSPGSGLRALTELVMNAYGMPEDEQVFASELDGADMVQALCQDRLDVIVYSVSHPAAAITEASNACDVSFVEVAGPAVDKLIEDYPFYRHAGIPAGMYKGQTESRHTFGVGATLSASAAVSDDVVYLVVKAVFDNIDEFRKLHPAFALLKEGEMIRDSLSAPLHAGAVRYYTQRGWM
jgi:TRAP transporter TAXI family solute receptor